MGETSIEDDGMVNRGDATHDEVSPRAWEIESLECGANEITI